MDMGFGAWNVGSQVRFFENSIKRIKCKLNLVGVQEVRLDKGGTEPADDYTFSYGNGNCDCLLGTAFSHIKES
jgi:hypothetical protein